MTLVAHNMSRIDAAIRLLLIPVVLVASGYVIHFWDSGWILPAVIFALPVVAYLVFTSVLRIDPVYGLYGLATQREARIARRRVVRARHRPLG